MASSREEYRKKRVKRIKQIIVTTCIILLLLPTVISIFLMIKVISMQKQIDAIAAGKIEQMMPENENVVQAKEKQADTELLTGGAVTVKKVYLTFEDGPGTNTDNILDILKKENVKATFFVTGKEDKYSKKMYKRIVKEGHVLGMHSYSHLYENIYKSASAFKKDFVKEYKLLYEVTGVYPKLYRFPGGSASEEMKVPIQAYVDVLTENETRYVDWNVISPEAQQTKVTKKSMVNSIMEDVKKYDTSIVLLYDVADKPMTVKSLSALIKKLKKENYELLPMDENTPLIQHNQ